MDPTCTSTYVLNLAEGLRIKTDEKIRFISFAALSLSDPSELRLAGQWTPVVAQLRPKYNHEQVGPPRDRDRHRGRPGRRPGRLCRPRQDHGLLFWLLGVLQVELHVQ